MISYNKKSVKYINADDNANRYKELFPRKSVPGLRESASTQGVLIHYHEIALKGKNRAFFENKLAENIKKSLKSLGIFEVKRLSGRLLVRLADKRGLQTDWRGLVEERLKKVFGIAHFCFSHTHRYTQMRNQIDTDKFIKDLCEDILELIKDKKFKSFKIDTKRADKNFPMTSQKINEKIGEHILDKIKNIKVNLENPDLTVFIEILPKQVFIYTEKIKGPGGLPVGTAGKVVSLISSGIDSPVASYNIMRRGAKIIFVHFHSYPKTNRASIENVENLVKILNQYQSESRLYLVPFLDIQKKILLKAPEKLRVVFYRRAMFKIAEEIAGEENARALVTGESLGQVASQTLENIEVISESVKIPIFRPLIGQDKEEIISLARKIGTYEISILPYEDCCSLFTPKHPETKAKIKEVKNIEKNLGISPLIKKALKGSEVKMII